MPLGAKKANDKSSQDAWHLFTAINWNMDFFVTADFALLGQIRSIQDKKLRKQLTALALSPTDLCQTLEVEPMTEKELDAETQKFRLFNFTPTHN